MGAVHKRVSPVEIDEHRRNGSTLEALAGIGTQGSDADLQEVLRIARHELEMDLAFVSQLTEEHQVIERTEGEAASFNLEEGAAIPLGQTYCQRMVTGQVPNVVRDVRRHPVLRDLSATTRANIGSYVGVPIRFSDGRLYGTFCILGHHADPSVDERDLKFVQILARVVGDWLERHELEEKNWRLEVRTASLNALLAALEARDGYTGEHSHAVVELARAVAQSLGLNEDQIADVEQVALVHDIGKIGIPDHILRKQGPLDEEEWELMKTHPAVGARIVEQVEELAHLAPAVLCEHERWDGNGYPNGVAGEDIPLASRIVLACDAWHAMTSDRPYRAALSVEEAVAELDAAAGTQFDQSVTHALRSVLANQTNEKDLRNVNSCM